MDDADFDSEDSALSRSREMGQQSRPRRVTRSPGVGVPYRFGVYWFDHTDGKSCALQRKRSPRGRQLRGLLNAQKKDVYRTGTDQLEEFVANQHACDQTPYAWPRTSFLSCASRLGRRPLPPR